MTLTTASTTRLTHSHKSQSLLTPDGEVWIAIFESKQRTSSLPDGEPHSLCSHLRLTFFVIAASLAGLIPIMAATSHVHVLPQSIAA
jgi:hypothetical protein